MKLFGKEKQKGFSLTEIMIVVGIIGIIVGISVAPSLVHTRSNAQTSVCVANLRHIEGAIVMYETANRSRPSALTDLVPAYIKSMPTCPATGTYTLPTTDTGRPTCTVSGHTLS